MRSNGDQRRQATPKTVEVYGGSGLGLNISRKICQIHGGEVGLSSKAGNGSTFGFFFKTKRPEQTELDMGCMQEQEIAVTSLENQIEQLGGLEETVESSFSGNLVNSPTEDTGDATDHLSDQQSVKYQHTAPVNSKIREKEPFNQEPNADKFEHKAQEHSQHLESDLTSFNLVKEHGSGSNQANPAQRRTGAHILLVEDNIINQKIVVRKLESRGYMVTAANNGKEAVELVERVPSLSTSDKRAFDICLMDMEMPVMDGNSATKVIRELEKQGRIEHIPILGVTANVRVEQQAEM
jgi:CheY-like chemotaxis protein